MKTKSYFISIIIIAVCTFYTCKKQKTNSNAIVHQDDDDLNSGPSGGPLQLNSAKELDRQLRQFAEALAGLVQNDNINKYGDENLMSILVSNMPHGENELGVVNFHDKVYTTGGSSVYKFNTSGGSAPNTNDLHTALVKSSALHSALPGIGGSWSSSFYYSFRFGSESYNLLLRVPQLDEQGYFAEVSGLPIIFIGQEVLGNESYFGYSWDRSTGKIYTHFMDDDKIENMIDNKLAYIVSIDFEDNDLGGNGNGLQSSNCDGGWLCGDDFCDLDCGEPEACLDCLFNGNRTLSLIQVKIDDDKRFGKWGNSPGVSDKYFVNALGGKYKLALNSTVIHANNKWDELRNEDIRPKWRQKEVKRVKIRTRKNREKGSATMKSVWLKGDLDAKNNNTGIILSKHFNPNKAKVYVSLYERDQFFVSKSQHSTPRSGLVDNMYWRSRNMPSLCGPAKEYYEKNNSSNPFPWPWLACMKEINPSDWTNPTGLVKDEITISSENVTFVLRYE